MTGTSGRQVSEKQMIYEKHRQAGVTFPSHTKQTYVTIVRLNLEADPLKGVPDGLKVLCTFLEEIDNGDIKLAEKTDRLENAWSPLARYEFTATIGFGKTFFRKLNILEKSPSQLYDLPDFSKLGDQSPYVLQQTDLIIQ